MEQKTSRFARLAAVVITLAAVGGGWFASRQAQAGPADAGAEALLRTAGAALQAAGSHRFEMSVNQQVSTPTDPDARFAAMQRPAQQGVSYAMLGVVQDARNARLSITQARGVGETQPGTIANAPVKDMLIANGDMYARKGDAWVQDKEFSNLPGLNGSPMPLLAAASDVKRLPDAGRAGGTFRRVGFALNSTDVLEYMLRERGITDPLQRMRVQQQGLKYEGTGELWVTAEGLPERLLLRMNLERGGENAHKSALQSETTFSDLGSRFDGRLFDANIAPLSLTDAAPLAGAGAWLGSIGRVTPLQLTRFAVTAAMLAFGVALLLLVARRRRGRALIAAKIAIVAALFMPRAADVNEAFFVAHAAVPERANQSEMAKTVNTARTLVAREKTNRFVAADLPTLTDLGDEDKDGLPNGFEIQYGTNPFAKDTDIDGASDYDEVIGRTCPSFPGDPDPLKVISDPINPDSNYDGLRDGEEFGARGECISEAGTQDYPTTWSDDNDDDGVPDSLDLSPFSKSGQLGGEFKQAKNATDNDKWVSKPGSNFTFDPRQNNPALGGNAIEPFYAEIQIRPYDRAGLNYAYKNALYWPKGDDKGTVQTLSGATGKMDVAPFLQVTVHEDDMPIEKYRTDYGIGATPVISGCVNNCDYFMTIPLVPVERLGMTHAFQAKVLYDLRSSSQIKWSNMRFKWAVRAHISRPPQAEGEAPVTGPQIIAVYDEGYVITGARVQRQGGAKALVAAPLPVAGAKDTLGSASLLRAGLEARFLPGGMTLQDVQNRFNIGSSATITERWGITHTFHVTSHMNFAHMDEMIFRTNMTLTTAMLDKAYPTHSVTPTLIIATEQRVSTTNIDEFKQLDYENIVFNLCDAPLVHSRGLKLATFQWDGDGDGTLALANMQDLLAGDMPSAGSPRLAKPAHVPAAEEDYPPDTPLYGRWFLMGMEDLLKWVDKNYESIFSKDDPLYAAGLSAVKLLVSSWHQIINAMAGIGGYSLDNLSKVISDSNLLQRLLQWAADNGFIPTQIVAVVDFLVGIVEAGGPLKWLEQQLNTVISFVDGLGKIVSGSTLTFSLNVPSEVPSGNINVSLADVLQFTRMVANVLMYFANLFGIDVLADIAKVLGTIIDIITKVIKLINSIMAVIKASANGFQAMATAVSKTMGTTSTSTAIVGVVLAVGMTLFSIWMILNNDDLPYDIKVQMIAIAVWEGIKAVAIAIIAVIPVWGQIVAFAIALINLFIGLFEGVAREVLMWIFDPIGAMLTYLNPDPEQKSFIWGKPRAYDFAMGNDPEHPQGGVLAGEPFWFEMSGSVTMNGSKRALKGSKARFYLGRYAGGSTFRLCGDQIKSFLEGTDAEDELALYVLQIVDGSCTDFNLPHTNGWGYKSSTVKTFDSKQYLTNEVIGTTDSGKMVTVTFPFDFRVKDFNTRSRLTVEPYKPMTNGIVNMDSSFDLTLWFENCGLFGLDCDEYAEGPFETPPGVVPIWFDILPSTMSGLWHWEQLINRDPDGDKLTTLKIPGTNAVINFDNMCPNFGNGELNPDMDMDGISDREELARGLSPCMADTDSDGAHDLHEIEMGTDPLNADTDGDGLNDGQETASWSNFGNGGELNLYGRWLVSMTHEYAGLPKPQAFPNPRYENFDGDHRGDLKEKEKLSSPNAWNSVALDDAADVLVAQQYTFGGGTAIAAYTPMWATDEAAMLTPTMAISLPVAFSAVTKSANVFPKVNIPSQDNGTVLPAAPDTHRWKFPHIALDRYPRAIISGTPTIVSNPVSLTVALTYSEAGLTRTSTTEKELFINRGGPVVTITAPISGSLLGLKQHQFAGLAIDPQGLSKVQVCLKTFPSCAEADWTNTFGGANWSALWTPNASGHYYLYARAWDKYGVPGAVVGPVEFNVDVVAPVGATFDRNSTAYLSTTLTAGLPTISVTGRITETAGAYASGAGNAVVRVQSNTDVTKSVPVDNQGQIASNFNFKWQLPMGEGGFAAPSAQRRYTLTVSPEDMADNLGPKGEVMQVLVDDYPPLVRANVPQSIDPAITGDVLRLGGRADDLTLRLTGLPAVAYAEPQLLTDRDTRFASDGRVFIVGDVNGDTLDDIAVAEEDPVTKKTRVGLFFGKPGGLLPSLAFANADVRFEGELGNTSGYVRQLARSMGIQGDLNGDGTGELIIGDPQIGDGKVYVVLGKRGRVGSGWQPTYTLASQAEYVLTRSTADGFGGAVAFAGDADGDGLADLLVGSRTDAGNSDNAYLYFGVERGAPQLASVLYGKVCSVGCTARTPSLAGLGDANGDGLSDVLVSIGGARAFLVHGRRHGEWPASTILSATRSIANGEFQGAFTGAMNVSAAGDLNADGVRDLLFADPAAVFSRVYVMYGRRSGVDSFGAPIDLPTQANASYLASEIAFGGGGNDPAIGIGIAPLGDVDRDGHGDFMLGQHGSTGSSRAVIVSGATISTTRDQWVRDQRTLISHTASGQGVGYYLSAGDVNGDGVNDILVGAVGDGSGNLFRGERATADVSGIGRVEIGLAGPIAPYSAVTPSMTLPTNWDVAQMNEFFGSRIATWQGSLNLTGLQDGDYRVYARARDLAGNQLKPNGWHIGTVTVVRNAQPISLSHGRVQVDYVVGNRLQIGVTGTLDSTPSSLVNAVRVFDGVRWFDQPSDARNWHNQSAAQRQDLRNWFVRFVARDAFGNKTHYESPTLRDDLVERPDLSSSLDDAWYTNITPTLVVTWPTITDLSFPVLQYAVIDTFTNTQPVTPVAGNAITKVLSTPGVFYGHVRAVDDWGNESVAHIGPFGVNRLNTPSVMNVDGELQADDLEVNQFTLLNYDPYAPAKPKSLHATWDASTIYLAHNDGGWTGDKGFAMYVSTAQAGGKNTSVGAGEPVHTLPFAADYAMVFASGTHTMYANVANVWTPVDNPASSAKHAQDGTEIALNRAQIGAVASPAVSVLAYAWDASGVNTVLPAAARPTDTQSISGSVTFVANAMSPLVIGGPVTGAIPAIPNQLSKQVIEPIVWYNLGATNVLSANKSATMTVGVHNTGPGIIGVPVTVTLGNAAPQLMKFTGEDSPATICIDCPVNGRRWVMTLTVAPNATAFFTLGVQALTPATQGVFSVPVTIDIAQWGLPVAPHGVLSGSYVIDNAVSKPQFVNPANTIWVKPGLAKLAILSEGFGNACQQELQANFGAGFANAGKLTEASVLSNTIAAGQTQVWQMKVVAPNGQQSAVVTRTVKAKSILPVLNWNPALVFNGINPVLGGNVQDESPANVFVSVNGGPYIPAFMNGGPELANVLSRGEADQTWSLPVNLGVHDGVTITVQMYAEDGAGNASAPQTYQVWVDNVAPAIAGSQAGGALDGTVTDGSGVALLEVSLDNGKNFTPVAIGAGGTWRYELKNWRGNREPVALLRATDVHGNISQKLLEIDPGQQPQRAIFLPAVRR